MDYKPATLKKIQVLDKLAWVIRTLGMTCASSHRGALEIGGPFEQISFIDTKETFFMIVYQNSNGRSIAASSGVFLRLRQNMYRRNGKTAALKDTTPVSRASQSH